MRTPNGSSGYCQVADWVLLCWTKSRGREAASLLLQLHYCGTVPFFIECLKWDTILKRVTIFPSAANATKVKSSDSLPLRRRRPFFASFKKRGREVNEENSSPLMGDLLLDFCRTLHNNEAIYVFPSFYF